MTPRIHVLIVDDYESVRIMMRETLISNGYQATAVSSGEEACQIIVQQEFSVVLLDMKMPGMGGLETLERIKRLSPLTEVIMLTGYGTIDNAVQSMKLGAYDYLTKPCEFDALESMILKAYERRQNTILKQTQEQLRALSAHLFSIQEEERVRIAREIHDELGQALTVLKIDLAWLDQRLTAEHGPLQQRMTQMLHLIDTTTKAVQRISAALRPSILDHFGLGAAMEWQIREFQERTGLQCTLLISPEALKIDPGRSTALFRILQEALTNVVRHAHATCIDINLREEGQALVLEVRDNGQGITDQEIADPRSLGLVGMRERVMPWGGTVYIHGSHGKGTVVKVSIPLAHQEE